MSQPANTEKLITSYIKQLDQIYGLYADSGMGYAALHEQAKKMFEEHPQQQILIAGQDLKTKETMMINSVSLEEFRNRNAPGHFNNFMIGNICLVLIYHLWEEHYRPLVATSLNLKLNDLKIDCIGDIRNLRNDIIHNNFKVGEKTKKNKIFTFFQDLQFVQVNNKDFHIITERLKVDLKSLIPKK